MALDHTHDFECSKSIGYNGVCRGKPWVFELRCMINQEVWTSFLTEPPDFQEWMENERKELGVEG